jgi:diguanylate cyclase (GGDEF)-like protein/PAS domain S-box-containing protein
MSAKKKVTNHSEAADADFLRKNSALTQAILDSVAAQIAVLDRNGVIVAVNEAWKCFGLENAAEPGNPVPGTNVGTNYLGACQFDTGDKVEDEFARKAREGIESVMAGLLPGFTLEYPCQSPSTQRWFTLSVTPLGGVSDGGVVIAHTDTTEHKLTELALRESEERWSFALESSDIGAWDWDFQTGHATYSKLWKEMLGYRDDEILNLADEWKKRIFPDDLPHVMEKIQDHLDGKTAMARIEFRMQAKDGSWKWILGRGKVVSWNADGIPVRMVGTNTDITESKRLEDQERHFAFHDVLTRLPNRRLLYDRLSHTLAANKRTANYGALMVIDLDNFKPLNDAYGHLVGDLLLIEVARRLTAHVRDSDTVARFGGDEFVVMLGALDIDMNEAAAKAYIVAEKISASLATPYVLHVPNEGMSNSMVEHHCSASIGIVTFGSHETSHDEIFKRADLAMYKAKDAGRNAIRVSEGAPAFCTDS